MRLSPGNTHNTPRPNFGKLGDDSSNENLDVISRLIFVCSVLILFGLWMHCRRMTLLHGGVWTGLVNIHKCDS